MGKITKHRKVDYTDIQLAWKKHGIRYLVPGYLCFCSKIEIGDTIFVKRSRFLFLSKNTLLLSANSH